MSAEVRAFEHIAEGDHKCWLWKRKIVSFLGAVQTERVVDSKTTRSQFYWMSKDSEEWNRDPGRTEAEWKLMDRQGRSSLSMLLVAGLLRRWTLMGDSAMVRSGRNHFSFPWRSRGRSRELISGLCTWLYFELCGAAEMFLDHRGVVHALNKCEVEIWRVY